MLALWMVAAFGIYLALWASITGRLRGWALQRIPLYAAIAHEDCPICMGVWLMPLWLPATPLGLDWVTWPGYLSTLIGGPLVLLTLKTIILTAAVLETILDKEEG